MLVCASAAHAVPVTDGLLLWLDAADPATMFQDLGLTTPALDGDPVAVWLDKSGNDFSATQPDMGLLPVRNDTAMNGDPALRFVGAEGDGMLIDDGLVLARPYTAFIVNQYYGDVRGRTLQGQDDNWLHGLWGGNISSYATGFIGANTAAQTNFTYVADTTGTPAGDSTFVVNGVDQTVDPAPTGAPGRLGLVSGGMFPLEVSDADISEVVIYNRVLTESELTDVRDYLYGKYAAATAESNTVLAGSLGTFTGGDAGEGLDLSGVFPYAINVGGPGGQVAGDAVFTDGSIAGMASGSSPGATISPDPSNEILNWHAPAYGDTANDDAIESVMESIRWFTPPGLGIDLEVDPGQPYKLQLLFTENCCDRGFDITVEGELVVDNLNIPLTQEGIANTAQGVVYSYLVTAEDDMLNIGLGGSNLRALDNNPILGALTLELVPEPAGLTLILIGLGGLLAARGRRRG